MKLLKSIQCWIKTLFSHHFNSPHRPRGYSRNAWFYRSKGNPTPAQVLLVRLGVG